MSKTKERKIYERTRMLAVSVYLYVVFPSVYNITDKTHVKALRGQLPVITRNVNEEYLLISYSCGWRTQRKPLPPPSTYINTVSTIFSKKMAHYFSESVLKILSVVS